MQKTNPWKNKTQQFHRDCFLYFWVLTVQGCLQRFGCEHIINPGPAELTLYREREAISPNFPWEAAVPLGVIHFFLLQAHQFLQERCVSVFFRHFKALEVALIEGSHVWELVSQCSYRYSYSASCWATSKCLTETNKLRPTRQEDIYCYWIYGVHGVKQSTEWNTKWNIRHESRTCVSRSLCFMRDPPAQMLEI